MVQMLLRGRYVVGPRGIPSHMASEHLRLLPRCGLLKREDSLKAYYQIAEPHLAKLMTCIEGRFVAADFFGP
jgi:hypothetical protein